jgi:hypothetical protein
MIVGSGYGREFVIIFAAKAANLFLVGININNKIKIFNFITSQKVRLD